MQQQEQREQQEQRDGTAAGDRAEVSRQELYQEYVRWYLESCPEAGSFRDSGLLERAAHYLRRDPRPEDSSFTVFPFYQAVSEVPGVSVSRHLRGFIKAAELLETLCVNLFLQPWKKEFKTLKSYTGPYVYHLLPVLSRSTIQSVLASIGYLPHPDAPQSEYKLSEDANMDKVILVGFELLLARVECSHLLELLEKDQVGPQELLEFLQRRVGPTKPEDPRERRTTTESKQKDEEKSQEVKGREPPLYSDTRLSVNPQPKPRRSHLISTDQSIMEMQRTYPDLAFRGRPLVPDKPQQMKNGRSGNSRAVHAASDNNSEDINISELLKRTTKVTPTTGSEADEVMVDDPGDDGCHDNTPRNSSSYSDSSEISGPRAMSLHITLRAGIKNEESLIPASESLRPASESLRPASESLRPASESLRPASESLRPASESLRPASESLRPASESLRPASESLRPASESLRPASESLRPASESLRPASESLRPAESQPTAEPSAENKGVDRAELPSLSSMDEQRDLEELAEKMDVLYL